MTDEPKTDGEFYATGARNYWLKLAEIYERRAKEEKDPKEADWYRGRAEYCRQQVREEKVIKIKELLAQGLKGTEIGKRIGCSRDTVSLIKTGKQWKHVR